MRLIFNEKKYVEKIILKKGIKNQDDLVMFIRYKVDNGFILKNEIHENAIKLCRKGRMGINSLIEDAESFNKYYEKALKTPLREFSSMGITEYEFSFVRKLDDVQKEKILFTILVLQKYFDGTPVFISIADLCRISMSVTDQHVMKKKIDEIINDGFLTRTGQKTYFINLSQEENEKSKELFKVDDYSHIPSTYLRQLKTNKYFYCEWCGKKVIYKKEQLSKSNKRAFCTECDKIKNKYRIKEKTI